jgi:hypothetical protein
MNIRLSESKFRNILTEMVKEVLLSEAKMSLEDVYNKYYSDIDKNIFLAAVKSDPTSKRTDDGNIIGIGKYVKWILKLVKQGKWKPGDSVETIDFLGLFDKRKNQLPQEYRDINRYKSIYELGNIVSGHTVKNRSEVKQDVEKVYEDDKWLVVIPHTKEAACYYGKNTEWCTAATQSDNMFDYYNNKGLLYINIDKVNNCKYQFHFETHQFMDEEDSSVRPNSIGLSEGAINYYISIGKTLDILYDHYKQISNTIYIVKLKNKMNMLTTDGYQLLFNIWFDYIEFVNHSNNSDNGDKNFGFIRYGYKYNYVDELGNILYKVDIDKWFDDVNFFKNGWGLVKIKEKYNYINSNAEFLIKDKYEYLPDSADDFCKGYARIRVIENGYGYKMNLIDVHGNLVIDEKYPIYWVDDISYFGNSEYAIIGMKNDNYIMKYNLINKKGDIFYKPKNIDLWFDNIGKSDSQTFYAECDYCKYTIKISGNGGTIFDGKGKKIFNKI